MLVMLLVKKDGKKNHHYLKGSAKFDNVYKCTLSGECVVQGKVITYKRLFDRPLLSCLLPLSQKESACENIHMKMCSANRFIFMQIKLIFE